MWLNAARLGGLYFRAASRGDLVDSLISAAYLVIGAILVVYSYAEDAVLMRAIAVGVLMLGGLIAWLAAHKRFRLIADTPTALLRSAAQGYVELEGRCEPIPGANLLHYGKTPPCLWYLSIITEHDNGFTRNRTNTRIERSDDTFLLKDDTGECVIDPDGAEVLSENKTSWRVGDTYYKVYYLMPGDRLYALGDLKTVRAADGTLDRKGDLNTLLRGWKQDKKALLAGFDTDGNGEIDVQEWHSAVAAAEREVDARHREMRLQPGYHIMAAPASGRPYLLSNRDPASLGNRYKWWAWTHLAVLVSACVWGLNAWVAPLLLT